MWPQLLLKSMEPRHNHIAVCPFHSFFEVNQERNRPPLLRHHKQSLVSCWCRFPPNPDEEFCSWELGSLTALKGPLDWRRDVFWETQEIPSWWESHLWWYQSITTMVIIQAVNVWRPKCSSFFFFYDTQTPSIQHIPTCFCRHPPLLGSLSCSARGGKPLQLF